MEFKQEGRAGKAGSRVPMEDSASLGTVTRYPNIMKQ